MCLFKLFIIAGANSGWQESLTKQKSLLPSGGCEKTRAGKGSWPF